MSLSHYCGSLRCQLEGVVMKPCYSSVNYNIHVMLEVKEKSSLC